MAGTKKEKFSAMRTSSSIFDIPKHSPTRRSFKTYLNAGPVRGGLLCHDDGPLPKFHAPNRKTDV
jgi:hypothetical protein